ncbi:MAG TPA: PfkB family carbohydrate kinase [Dehalococcoidia bacterium]|jgi:sugar/nucleoside kinase (ribokinase family)|nr:PfkB family carbohydrate kinase [Dehalococcoidia bacterium]
MRPQFLVIGHTVQDLTSESDPASWRLGGAAAFAAVLARNLGLRVAVLTSASPDLPLEELLPGIEIATVPARRTTQMRNVYEEGPRRQFVPQRAAPLSAEHLPPEWRQMSIVFLGPVIGELDESFPRIFNGSLLGIGAQGWLRRVARDTRVRPIMPADFHVHGMLKYARALFLSDEDIPPGESAPALTYWSDLVQVIAFTRGYNGADVCLRGNWRHIDAFPANTVDPTGAGDVFAAAFLIRLWESGDVWKATRFAACAASLSVEGEGISAIPSRDHIEARLREHPNIVAR